MNRIMRCLPALVLAATAAHADFRIDVPKSAVPGNASLTSGAMVVDSGGSRYLTDTGISGVGDTGDPYLHVHFALDAQVANGSEINALFLFFVCNGIPVNRTWEGSQTYFHGTPLPFVYTLSGLEVECAEIVPVDFQLLPVAPNPVSSSVSLRFGLPATRTTRLRLYDMQGNVVRTLLNSSQTAGLHSLGFSAQGLPMGMYQLSLAAGSDSTGQPLCLQGEPLTWIGTAAATTDEDGRCFLPASLFPPGVTLQALDASGNSLGSHTPGLGIVLVKSGQRLSGCTLTAGADGTSDYIITLP